MCNQLTATLINRYDISFCQGDEYEGVVWEKFTVLSELYDAETLG